MIQPIKLAWSQPNARVGRPWRASCGKFRYEIRKDHHDRYVPVEIAPGGARRTQQAVRYLCTAKSACHEMAGESHRQRAEA
jgi:hypothetical protein